MCSRDSCNLICVLNERSEPELTTELPILNLEEQVRDKPTGGGAGERELKTDRSVLEIGNILRSLRVMPISKTFSVRLPDVQYSQKKPIVALGGLRIQSYTVQWKNV